MKKLLSLLLSLMMVLSLCPMNVTAEETAEPVPVPVTEEKQAEPEAVEPAEETAEPETVEPTEEAEEAEAIEPAEEAEEPEVVEPTEEAAEPEAVEPAEETAEPEVVEPTEEAEEAEAIEPAEKAEEPEAVEPKEETEEAEVSEPTEEAEEPGAFEEEEPLPKLTEDEPVKLAGPESVRWEGYVGKWEAVEGAEGYRVELDRFNGSDYDLVFEDRTSATEYDFGPEIETCGVGEYYFMVRALGDGETTQDSDDRWPDNSKVYGLTPMNPPQDLRWDGAWAQWNRGENDEEDIAGYIVMLFNDDAFITVVELGPDQFEQDFCDEIHNAGAGNYVFAVTVVGDPARNRGNSEGVTSQIKVVGDTNLDEPENVHWDGFTGKWDTVEGAAEYELELLYNDEGIRNGKVTAEQMDFSEAIAEYGNGVYQFCVSAKGADEGVYSGDAWSEELYVGMNKLETPQNVRWVVEDGHYIARWDAVENALNYSVFIAQNHEYFDIVTTGATSIDFTERLTGTHAQYDFNVVAKGNGGDTLDSEGMWCEERLLFGLEQLPEVENPRWDGKVARWDQLEVEGVSCYELILWQNDWEGRSQDGIIIDPDADSFDLSEYIDNWGNGIYWFGIYGHGDYETTADGVTAYSDELYVGLEKIDPPARVWWTVDEGTDSYVANWEAVEGAAGYYVQLNRNDHPEDPIFCSGSVTDTSFDFSGIIEEAGGVGKFDVFVVAQGDLETTDDSDPTWNERSLILGLEVLPDPENVRWVQENDHYIARWDAVEGAAGYNLMAFGDTAAIGCDLTPEQTEYDLTEFIVQNGRGGYDFAVFAYGDYETTASSPGVFSEMIYVGMTKLDTPQNVRWVIEDGRYIARWDVVENACNYSVFIAQNHTFFDIVETGGRPYYDITERIAGTHGQYDFQVTALGNGVDILDSESMWCSGRLLFGLEELPEIENPRWDGTTARWDKPDAEGVVCYEIILWQNGWERRSEDMILVDKDADSFDLSEYIDEWGDGIYRFGIYAYGDYETTSDGVTAYSDNLYVGCRQLDAPVNPVWSGTTAKWGKVTGAVRYEIALYSIMNDEVYFFETSALSYKFASMIKQLGPDGYFFDVRAIGDSEKGILDSEWAVNDNYLPVDVKMLPAPENVRWDGTTVRWDEVEDASGYMLHLDRNGERVVNGWKTAADATSVDFTDVIDESGDGLYEVGVHTVGDVALGTCTGHGAYAEYLKGVARTYLENVRWEGYTARWDDDPNAEAYDITLKLAGKALRTYKITDNSYDFEALIKEFGAGIYSFDLMAKGSRGYVDAVSKGHEKDFTATHVTAITLSDKALTLGIGEGAQITWQITPDYAEDEITISSSRPAVCGVDTEGNLYPVAKGSAVITVASANKKKATCKVTVKDAPEEIGLSADVFLLAPGEERTLTATFLPKTAAGTIVWRSPDPGVATVENGVVKAVTEGSVDVIASTYNGVSAHCKVTVSKEPDRIDLSAGEIQMSVKQPGFRIDTVPCCGAETTYGAITLDSDDTRVLRVDGNGTLTAVKAGTATVTATLYNGVCAECKVTVVAAPAKVTLNETKATLKLGDPINGILQLEETVFAEGTPYSGSWTSSKESVAKVDRNGLVTACGTGSATITYKTFNGKSAKCAVKVCNAPDTIALDAALLPKKTGDVFALTATISPAGFEDAPLNWTSSRESVAAVDENGVVTVVGTGKAVITVRTENGKTARCTVNGYDKPYSVTLSEKTVKAAVGETFPLIAMIVPAGFEDALLNWTSSRESVAVVDENGVVTTVAKGKAVITVRTENGKTAKCTVTVG